MENKSKSKKQVASKKNVANIKVIHISDSVRSESAKRQIAEYLKPAPEHIKYNHALPRGSGNAHETSMTYALIMFFESVNKLVEENRRLNIEVAALKVPNIVKIEK